MLAQLYFFQVVYHFWTAQRQKRHVAEALIESRHAQSAAGGWVGFTARELLQIIIIRMIFENRFKLCRIISVSPGR